MATRQSAAAKKTTPQAAPEAPSKPETKTKVKPAVTALVKKLTDEGADRDTVIIALHGQEKVSLAAAAKLFNQASKELGLTIRTRQTGFRGDFYEYLKEGKRTAEQVEKYVKENGSENDVRHLTHYQGLAELTNAIHEAKAK